MATTLPPDFKEFLKLLKEHDVQYLLIGGYAVNLIDLQNLKKNKKASGRAKDLDDIEKLP